LPRLKEWTVAGVAGGKRVGGAFPRPVAHGGQQSLEVISPPPFGANTLFPLPAPPGGDTAGPGLLAYPAPRLAAQHREDSLRINFHEAEKFRGFWKAAGMPSAGRAIHAYSYSRQGGDPVLHLQLQARAAIGEASQSLSWRIGSRQADLDAEIKIKARKPVN